MDSYVALIGSAIILASLLLYSFLKKSKVFTFTAGIGLGIMIGAVLENVIVLLR